MNTVWARSAPPVWVKPFSWDQSKCVVPFVWLLGSGVLFLIVRFSHSAAKRQFTMTMLRVGIKLVTLILVVTTPANSQSRTKCCPGSKVLDAKSRECLDISFASPLSQPDPDILDLDRPTGNSF